jgi:outer membrane protein assembly factor BamA
MIVPAGTLRIHQQTVAAASEFNSSQGVEIMTLPRVLITGALVLVIAAGQQPEDCHPAAFQTRAEEIEEARDLKTAALAPEQPGTLERHLIRFKDEKLLERFTTGIHGVRLDIGGMPTGSGFAIGPHYVREELGGSGFAFDALANVSSRGWRRFEMGLAAPNFRSGRSMLDVRATRYDYNSIPFYGTGPESVKDDRSNYGIEDSTFDALAGLRLRQRMAVGASVGYQSVRVGEGQDQRYASVGTAYPDVLQGNTDRTHFLRVGAFAQIDDRDNPEGPRRGRVYVARFDDYRARSGKPFSFQRLDIEVQQYIPFFNERRVIALRARTQQSFTHGANQVPFFHQAVLGGGDDLRGFRQYRFQDDNMFVMNAEYRWEVFSGLDMAAFGDAGRVTKERWKFDPRNFETSVGFGLRFNARNRTFLRTDIAFSHEGFQVFVKFNGAFRERRLGSSSSPHIF